MGTSTAFAAVVAALLAALCYAIGAALEQKEASAAATQRVVHPGLLWQVLQRPVWLAGFAVMAVGEVLHVLALAWAPLAVVQPIGVTTVLFALPIGALVARRRPRLPELAAAAVTVAGLAALLTGMKVSTAEPALSGHDLAVLAPVAVGGLALLTLVALRASGALRTLLLGCGSGAAFGVTAALVRLLTHRVEVHGASGLVGWVTPVIAVTAVAGLLLEQGAYKSGHLGVAVAGYTVTDPLVAVVLGAWVLHQPARASHPLWAAGEALVVMTGVVLLARATAAPGPQGAAASGGLIPGQLAPGHRLEVHVVGAVGDPERAARGVQLRERHVAGQPERAVHLDRAVDDPAGRPRHRGLDGGDLDPGALGSGGVEQPGGFLHEQAELLDLDACLGDVTPHAALSGQR
jgi:drug/metabolite transporter (DMT)-like permease